MIETYCDTILVVDDNQAILTALKISLAGAFRRVLTLESPDNLVATLKKEDVDVVLLDMNFSLGVNTGHAGLFWLRTLKKLYPDTPVVLMTAYADVQLAVKGLKNGAADFVTKPWDNDELIRTLRDAVEKNRVVVPLDKMEQQHVHRVVEQCHGNMSRAAELLGITRQTLYRKLKTDNWPQTFKYNTTRYGTLLYYSISHRHPRSDNPLGVAPPAASLLSCTADA